MNLFGAKYTLSCCVQLVCSFNPPCVLGLIVASTSLASNSFTLLILQPTRITIHPKTLIDNIFSNIIDADIISGSLAASISDHLSQFAIIPNIFGNTASNKFNIYESELNKFDQFNLDYFPIEWENLLKVNELNVVNST